MGSDIPSPRQGECKPIDRSAIGFMRQLIEAAHPHTWWGRWVREDIALAELHARNVDKQRRRLLAERLERKAHALAMHDAAYQLEHMKRERLLRREKKLRTVAARLRGTK